MTAVVADRAVTTLSSEAESVPVPVAMRRAWDPAGYVGRNQEKADLARALLHWLARAEVREYVSPEGYRMLIIGPRGAA